ncbi:hypothetical protein ACWEPC_15775 [Nonomuraea sp. NPDC004297]
MTSYSSGERTAAPARRLVILGVALAMGATVLGGAVPAASASAPPEGAYWHTRSLMTNSHPWRFGSKSDPYSLVQRSIMEEWSAPDATRWFGWRELETLPATARDRKAWQRDGSPSRWSESIDGKTVKLSTEPAKGRVNQVRDQRQRPETRNKFELGGQWLTYEEVQRLPADPDRLKGWLTEAARVGRIEQGSVDHWLSSTLRVLLYDLPAPKEVRAAAYRALLTLPHVRSGGDGVRDPLGRSGSAVVIDQSTGTGKKAGASTVRLIVDTGRMVLLSSEQTMSLAGEPMPGKSYIQTMIEVGWTDSRPAVPALP